MFRRKALEQGLILRVKLLTPDEELDIRYNNTSLGQDIIDDVAKKIDLRDKDYYGLKLQNQIQWLDPTKLVTKQTKKMEPVVLELRFKFYPAEPALLANESTRYYLYLQLRLDLLEGRLRSEDQDTLAYLIACTLQSELGDIETKPILDSFNYVSEFKFVPNQTADLEWNAIRFHLSEDFQGLVPGDAELNFLKKASKLDTYGIDPYPVKEGSSHNHFLIGVNYLGISTFQDSKKTNQFAWSEIERISLDNKLVLIYCNKIVKKGSKIKPLFGFRCPSLDHAHNFWKIATEHRYFFTLESTPVKPLIANTGGLLKKSHKLKYTGRVEKDVLKDNNDDSNQRCLKRSNSLLSKSVDGPRWQGFHDKSFEGSSMRNIYASDAINRTMPSDLACFREEEEEPVEDCNEQISGLDQFGNRKRQSISSAGVKTDQGNQFTGRRSNLTSKRNSSMNDNSIKKDDHFYTCSDQQDRDLIKITVFLITILMITFVGILLIQESDRPDTINLIIKRMNLEQTSKTLRESFYLPIRSALNVMSSQIITSLNI